MKSGSLSLFALALREIHFIPNFGSSQCGWQIILISNLFLNNFLEGQGKLEEKEEALYTTIQLRYNPYSNLNYKIQESNQGQATLDDNARNYCIFFLLLFIFFLLFFFSPLSFHFQIISLASQRWRERREELNNVLDCVTASPR